MNDVFEDVIAWWDPGATVGVLAARSDMGSAAPRNGDLRRLETYTGGQMFARWRSEASYDRSQAATGLPVRPTPVARGLALRILSAGDEALERQRVAQHLVDELNRVAGLPPCQVVVPDRPQVHQHDGHRLQEKTYGYYKCKTEPGGRVAWARIRIYHRTAVQKRVISAKVFLNTVLHEWMHHFDFHGLRLAKSYHTAGFFKRLRTLAESLEVGFVLPPDPDDLIRRRIAPS